jgi:hypothetical protein
VTFALPIKNPTAFTALSKGWEAHCCATFILSALNHSPERIAGGLTRTEPAGQKSDQLESAGVAGPGESSAYSHSMVEGGLEEMS